MQRAKRLFSALPRPVQLAACALVFLVLGYLIGWVRTVAGRYSPADYQEQVARADKAERDLSALNARYSTIEADRSRFKVAAESRAKDVVHIRKLMNELRAEKDVPDWALKEKWAEAQAEIVSKAPSRTPRHFPPMRWRPYWRRLPVMPETR